MLWALLYSASSLTHPPQHDYITLLHYIILLHYLQFPKEFYTLLQPPAFRHIFHSAWTPFLSFLLLANSYLYFRSQFRYFFLCIYLFIFSDISSSKKPDPHLRNISVCKPCSRNRPPLSPFTPENTLPGEFRFLTPGILWSFVYVFVKAFITL